MYIFQQTKQKFIGKMRIRQATLSYNSPYYSNDMAHISFRWLIVKDTFLAYLRPSDGAICDVMLMDSDFKVDSGMDGTGARHGILVMNLTR